MINVYVENVSIDNYKPVVDGVVQDTLPEDLTNRSTRGEKSKQYDLTKLVNVNENFTALVNKIKENALSCLHRNNLHYIKKLSPLTCWTIYGEENGYHLVHRHNGRDVPHIATVTYLKTPAPKTSNAGNFFYFLNDEVHEIIPVEGQMLIMPVWVLHGTYPQSEGLRQTLNIDFVFETALN
jgi:hypothetical protein